MTRASDYPKRVLFAATGLVVLLLLWQGGAFIVQHTAQEPNLVWPSLDYIAGPGYREIGLVRGTDFAGDAASTARSRSTYWDATVVLLRESARTAARVILGSFIGIVVGLTLGLLVGLTRITQRLVYPSVNLARQIPLLGISILFFLWFGSTERAVYAYVIFGVSTLIMLNTINAVRNIPSVQLDYARALGASKHRVVKTVIIPAILPELIAGIKVAVGLAWAMVLGMEYVVALPGLGRLMLFFELFGFAGRMAAIMFLFILYALLTHMLVTALGNRVTRWAPRAETGLRPA